MGVSRVPATPTGPSLTWAPLGYPAFRSLWIAQFVANTGTWAQTVGAQWLMGDLGGGALEVALVQTATTLPVFLLVVPSGALGDILDRRRLLLASNLFMFAGSATLAALTGAGLMTPATLLALTAVVGMGAAVALPSFAAIQPELVPRERIPQAALLNGANLNVARAVGPALGGVLIGAVGPEATFALNAVSFLFVAAALRAWQRAPDERPLGTEQVVGAVAAAVRYIRNAPAFGIVLARTTLFIVFASALWALLPVVARGPLHLDASGYGLLLASIGAGAISGAFVVPALRRRMESNQVVAYGSVAYAVALLAVGLGESLTLVIPALVVAGLGWITVMSSLSACAQILLPNWIRARGLAFYTLTFMGGQALGSVAWGGLASAADLETALGVAAAGTLLGPLISTRGLALPAVPDVEHAHHWPEPNIALEVESGAGPVFVTVDWRVRPGPVQAFIDAMRPVGRARRRSGATFWDLFQDAAEPLIVVEVFRVETWQEHMRQHIERGTVMEAELEAEARRYLADGAAPRVRHLVRAGSLVERD
jgi:MFS family permease